MTTHPRARGFQAGAFLALIGGFLVVAPTPAFASAPSVIINGPSPINLKAGESVGLTYRVTNTNQVSIGTDDTATITVTVNGQLRCEGTCGVTTEKISAGQSTEHSITLVAGTVPSGAAQPGSVTISATLGGESSNSQRSVTVRGDDKPPTAKQVSGKLRDADKKAVADADVFLSDSAGHRYASKTNGSGSFRFFSSDQQPISPGTVYVGAQKTGFQAGIEHKNVDAGGSVTINLTMTSTASPSPSASPSASLSASAAPADPTAGDETTDPPAPALTDVAGSAKKDDGGSSTLFLLLGGLLVAAGIGAIVLLVMRRRAGGKRGGPDSEDGAPTAPRPVTPSGAPAPAPSRYDATRIAGAGAATRIGTGGVNPAEATMVTTAALPPSLSNAPTLMQQAVQEDEFPDPYGAPVAVPHAGYAAAAAPAVGAWGAATPGTGGYGTAAPQARPAPGVAAQGAAVPYVQPAPRGGYSPDQQQRYDEPTGLWNPQVDNYPDDGGYPQVDEHGQPLDGYHQADAYHPAPGYPERYGPETGYDQAGYADQGHQPDAGYEHQAGYPPVAGGYPAPHQQVPNTADAYQANSGYAAAGDGYESWNSSADGIDNGGAYGAPVGGYAPEGDYRAATPGGYDETTGYAPRATYQQAPQDPAGYGRPDGYGSAPAQPDQGRSTAHGRAAQGRPVPVHGQPAPGQPMPGQPMPGQPVPGQPVPGRPVPGRPSPGRAPQGRPVPNGSAQGVPVHGPAAPGRAGAGRPTPGPGGQADDYYGEEPAAPVGRHGAPPAPAQSTRPGQRRQIDWLDD